MAYRTIAIAVGGGVENEAPLDMQQYQTLELNHPMPEPRHMLIAHSITTSDFRSCLDELIATRPNLEALLYLVGPDKILEWAHTIGVATEVELAALAPPIPSIEMRNIVAAQSEPVFLWSGLRDAEIFADVYARNSKTKNSIAVLDFGAGCGRVAQFFAQAPQYRTFVCDVNPDLVAWCRETLPNVIAAKNDPLPPLPFEAETFDFIFALSVFTHLPEAAAFAWLRELSRILRPAGIAALSTHGPTSLSIIASSDAHQQMFRFSAARANEILTELERNSGFIYVKYDPDTLIKANAGKDYGNSFTHEKYIRARWPEAGFEALEFMPAGVRGWQDIAVLKKLDSQAARGTTPASGGDINRICAVGPPGKEVVMNKALYIVYFSGTAGQGIGLFYIGAGLIAGIDTGAMRYEGSFSVNADGSLEGTVEFEPQRASVKIYLPANFADGRIIEIETPLGKVNARFEKLKEIP